MTLVSLSMSFQISKLGRQLDIPYLARPWLNLHRIDDVACPPWLSSLQVQYAAVLFAKPIAAHPVIVADTIQNMPMTGIPQVAFIGRSNVGKSSLINALMHGREITKISSTPVSSNKKWIAPTFAPVSHNPGRTRHLFTFDLGDHLSLVDLPGYGFAKVEKNIRDSWAQLIDLYLQTSVSLRRVVCLIDVCTGLQNLDHKLLSMLQQLQIPFQVVLTKVDLAKPLLLHNSVLKIREELLEYDKCLLWPYLHSLSAKRYFGLTEFRCSLAAISSDERQRKGKRVMLTNKKLSSLADSEIF